MGGARGDRLLGGLANHVRGRLVGGANSWSFHYETCPIWLEAWWGRSVLAGCQGKTAPLLQYGSSRPCNLDSRRPRSMSVAVLCRQTPAARDRLEVFSFPFQFYKRRPGRRRRGEARTSDPSCGVSIFCLPYCCGSSMVSSAAGASWRLLASLFLLL